MTEKAQFAALLAQVIPVAILAVVVESRSGHEARAKAEGEDAPPTWLLVLEAITATGLVFVEVAALMTAAGSNGGLLNWLAGRPGAIGVCVLLVQVGALHVVNTAEAYERSRKLRRENARAVKITARVILYGSVVFALVAVVCCA
ncbi:hypothetical protein [Streptomyces swartbergensis]|uniref:hypothetical protein n=1 Tax=Streptomyces swartbergensis TaxID=487165 RepID=UPI0037FD8053